MRPAGALLFATLILYKCSLVIERATSSLKQLEQETLCSKHWIDGLDLLHVSEIISESCPCQVPAFLIKRVLAQPAFGSYSTAGLLIKWGHARSRDVMGPISACKCVSETEQNILIQPFVCCSRAGKMSAWAAQVLKTNDEADNK